MLSDKGGLLHSSVLVMDHPESSPGLDARFIVEKSIQFRLAWEIIGLCSESIPQYPRLALQSRPPVVYAL